MSGDTRTATLREQTRERLVLFAIILWQEGDLIQTVGTAAFLPAYLFIEGRKEGNKKQEGWLRRRSGQTNKGKKG